MPKSKSGTGPASSVRIIGGTHRTRRVHFQDAPGLRPTHDRIRETLFNWLRDDIRGARCLDLFAGSGALGFESLSRGASHVDFVDSNRKVKASIDVALKTMKFDNASVHCADALTWLVPQSPVSPQSDTALFDIVFLDPPFAANLMQPTFAALTNSQRLKPGCKIYIETEAKQPEYEVPAHWQQLKAKRTGSVSFRLYVVPDTSGKQA